MSEVRFIRKNGRVIPIKISGKGSRAVSEKQLNARLARSKEMASTPGKNREKAAKLFAVGGALAAPFAMGKLQARVAAKANKGLRAVGLASLNRGNVERALAAVDGIRRNNQAIAFGTQVARLWKPMAVFGGVIAATGAVVLATGPRSQRNRRQTRKRIRSLQKLNNYKVRY